MISTRSFSKQFSTHGRSWVAISLLFMVATTATYTQTGEIWSVSVDADGTRNATHQTIHAAGILPLAKKAVPPQPTRPPKIEPALADIARVTQADQLLDVIAVFIDDVRIPVMPALNPHAPLEDAENQAILVQRRLIAADLASIRQPKYAARTTEFATLGIVTVSTSWLDDSMLLRVPARALQVLVARPDLQVVERTVTDTPPPNIQTGRTQMRTDYLKAAVDQKSTTLRPRIALIDTGAPIDHEVFNPRTRIIRTRDCATPDHLCVTTTLRDACVHATPAANILTGLSTGSQGDVMGGVTSFDIGTYNVYQNCLLDRVAAATAIDTALLDGFPVIVVNVQDQDSEVGTVAARCDRAYLSGAVVIAPTGNYGQNGAGSVTAPANSHYTLAAGSYDLNSFATPADQGRGPTNDGRTKPDVQGPTNVTAASNAYSNYGLFSGTSCSAPFVAAAAALAGWFVNDDLIHTTYQLDPGYINAFVIDSGRSQPANVGTCGYMGPVCTRAFNETEGAGRIVFPGTGNKVWYGWVDFNLVNGQYFDVFLPVQASGTALSAAIWWPDPGISATDLRHNDIDLSMFDWQGHWRAISDTSVSVFEKVWAGPVNASYGTWTIRIVGYNVPAGPQRAYFAAHVVY